MSANARATARMRLKVVAGVEERLVCDTTARRRVESLDKDRCKAKDGGWEQLHGACGRFAPRRRW